MMHFNFTLLILFFLGFSASSRQSSDLKDLGLKIEQGKESYVIHSSEQTIQLNKDKFSMVFNLKKDDEIAEVYYAARVIADIDPDIFKQFEADTPFEKVPALAEGTSMAGPKDAPYECIFFHDQAHHYIFYSNEEAKRANIVSKENDELQLSFDIENYCMQDLEVNIKNSNFEQIYLVFFIDKNLNEIVEDGEFVKLEINFA